MAEKGGPQTAGGTVEGRTEREPVSPGDRPWLFRTYAGHTSAAESNALFRTNLGRGQTGLSVAFDLPTQTGYDSDHARARGEVGRVGVPVCHLGDMDALFADLPLDRLNTSMTINATAPWIMALYIATAEDRGLARRALSGTIQNDIIKEYLSRGTHIFPPEPSLRLASDVIAFCCRELPKWNPVNVCSYHLQEAGAEPVQEVAFALANAIALLDLARGRADVSEAEFPEVVGRISFFVNAGIRFISEACKMRAFAELWEDITARRYGVKDAKLRRFRYGVQVNSLGLTEQQPENNVYRILLEMLSVVLSKSARARAVQLPAWNEAMGLPRPWDQQWSLRAQQILAYETDLLEYEDIFAGSRVIEAKVAAFKTEVLAELKTIEDMGGALAAVDSGYMKSQLVAANARRLAAIESGETVRVGVNAYRDSADSPLAAAGAAPFVVVDEAAEADQIAGLKAWRRERDGAGVESALAALSAAAAEGSNIMDASIDAARAGATTGEWASTLREVFGEYAAPTGLGGGNGGAAPAGDSMVDLRKQVDAASEKLGRRLKLLVGKPGLDGHSSGAEQIATRARDAGFEVVYQGIRLSSGDIAAAALEEGVHVVGLSVLSGGHVRLAGEVVAELKRLGIGQVPVVVGGIVPAADIDALGEIGVARVYTPKDYRINDILSEIVDLAVAATVKD